MSVVLNDQAGNGSGAPSWLQALQQARSEWRANTRLRWGVWAILAIFWLWLSLLAQDQATAWRGEADEARAELQRLRPLQSGGAIWTQRAEDARKHLEAARSMLWSGSSQGLVEAALQDTLRAWAEKSGLPVRELSIMGAGERARSQPAVRARLVVDMNNRLALMGLLAELGRSPKLMLVDSLRLRPLAQPARAELEVRVLFQAEERKP